MPSFLIEVPHDPEPWACARVIETFLSTGSHYLASADWGCGDGDHTAWMIVNAENHDEARAIVPPPLRSDAHVVKLNKFTLDSLERAMTLHRPGKAEGHSEPGTQTA